MNEVARSKNIERVSDSDIGAYWRPTTAEPSKIATDLKLPFGCHFLNNIFNISDESRMVRAGFLKVSPHLRGNGVGARLVRGLGALTQEYEFPGISVCLASQYSLDIFEDVFGRDRMTLRTLGESSIAMDLNRVATPETMERLDISFENARAILVALEQAERDLENRQIGFPVTVDLGGLDMSSWELPKEHCKGKVDIESILQSY